MTHTLLSRSTCRCCFRSRNPRCARSSLGLPVRPSPRGALGLNAVSSEAATPGPVSPTRALGADSTPVSEDVLNSVPSVLSAQSTQAVDLAEQAQEHGQQQQPPQEVLDIDREPQTATRHGPGFCACCRPVGTGEPITQVITYVDGVVLEVETADGDVVYFDDEDGDGASYYAPYSQNTQTSSTGGAARGAPLVYVPDMVIPPPAPTVLADFVVLDQPGQ